MSDIEFISNVQTLATNGTLMELLRRLEEDQVQFWKNAPTPERREDCWHALQAIILLRTKIESFNNQDKIQNWNNQRITRRI
jgi:hypothetical protein